jgi:hypothetical protein
MASLTSQLITAAPAGSASAAPVGAPSPARPDEGDQVIPANEAERDALGTAKTAEDLALSLGSQMEKVASRGGQVPDGAASLRQTLEKLAHYVRSLVRTNHARTKYAEYCLEQAVHGATQGEAFKLASEMVADGIIEVPDGKTVADLADELLADGDLGTFKRAVDLVASGRLTRLGEVEATDKQAHVSDGPIGDSDPNAHDWLLNT